MGPVPQKVTRFLSSSTTTSASPSIFKTTAPSKTWTSAELDEVQAILLAKVPLSDRRYRLTLHRKVFLGSEFIDTVLKLGIASTREAAKDLGTALMQRGAFAHVYREHGLNDGYFFYRWSKNEGHGRRRMRSDGKTVSWSDVVPQGIIDTRRDTICSLQPDIPPELSDERTMSNFVSGSSDGSVPSGLSDPKIVTPDYAVEQDVATRLAPLDVHNLSTLDLLHPPGWIDPKVEQRYNLVVIGGGCAGFSAAADAAALGAKVALIEKDFLGGISAVTGIVPTSTFLNIAKGVSRVTQDKLRDLGIRWGEGVRDDMKLSFEAVMRRVRRERAENAAASGDAQYLAATHGFDLFIGRGHFCGRNVLTVNGQALRFAKAIIATGSTPDIPEKLTGLCLRYQKDPENSPVVLTHENVFNLTKLPPRLCIMGVGPWAIEMAQAFARLGSEVRVVSRSKRILGREDEDLAEIINVKLQEDNVDFCLSVKGIESIHIEDSTQKPLMEDTQGSASEKAHSDNYVNPDPESPSKTKLPSTDFPQTIVMHLKTLTEIETIQCDALLIATGSRPRIHRLGLRKANVWYTSSGVVVDDCLRTSNPSIYAIGDVTNIPFKQIHTAEAMAHLAVKNALFIPRLLKFSSLVIPWTTKTEPGLAHVGLYETDLRDRGIIYETIERTFKDEDSSEGLVRIHFERRSGKIFGCSILGSRAGEMISEVTAAMELNTPLCQLSSVIHPAGSHSVAFQVCADLRQRSRVNNKTKLVLRSLLRLTR